MEQIQCPNCGGYRTEITGRQPVRAPGTTPTKGVKQIRVGCLALLFGPFIIATAYTVVFFIYVALSSGLTEVLLYAAIMFLILAVELAVPLLVWRSYASAPMVGAQIGTVYHYYCYICGYKWSWETGIPKPDIRIRPDLIAKGEQRLEEERRRQAEAAAAAWWLQQQQKKK